jgi:5-methyltetrahydrofolate--homocysteine methyltransferase
MMSDKYQQLFDSILEGDVAGTEAGVNQALEAKDDPAEILNQGMIAAMREVGRLFEEGEYYVPEMLIAARAMQAGLVILKPHLVDSGIEPSGLVAVGTVKGDLHDIGKNLVIMMLKGAGFEVIDAGVDVSADAFVEKAKESGTQIVGLSALLTTTMPAMETAIKAIKDSGLDVKTMIGGAPITQAYADKIGADGYSADAASAVDTAKELLGL